MTGKELPKMHTGEYVINCFLGALDPNIVMPLTRNQIENVATSVISTSLEQLHSESHAQGETIFLTEIDCHDFSIDRPSLFGALVAEGIQRKQFANPKFKTNTFRYTLCNIMGYMHDQILALRVPTGRDTGFRDTLTLPIQVNDTDWILEASYSVSYKGVGDTLHLRAIPNYSTEDK